MNLNLAGKRALVTGYSAGIGEAIARSLAAEGARVIVHGRNRERAERVANDIKAKGGDAEIVLGDLSSDAEAAIVTASALSGGPVDVLVNNAGSYKNGNLGRRNARTVGSLV